jgi:transcriptional antiterminator RfaH
MLAPEPNCFPEDLLSSAEAHPQAGRAWLVAHTKPRQEKALARQMYDARLPFYLPLTPRRCVIRGKVRYSHVPLFPGYVFLQVGPEERISALATGRVVRCLTVPEQDAFRRDLWQLTRLLGSGLAVDAEERLKPGDEVTIQYGPLAGLKGTVVREASGRRFVVRVDFIHKGASVLLDDSALRGT